MCGGEGADGSAFVLNLELEPTDEQLAAAPGAEERTAHHKALGAKAFGAKVRCVPLRFIAFRCVPLRSVPFRCVPLVSVKFR